MATRAGLLLPREHASPYRDLAQRRRLIRGQRLPLFAPKVRARRRGRVVSILRAVGAGLGLGALGILGWHAARFLLSDPRFAVAEIRVKGAERLTPETVRDAAAVEAQNLFRLDLKGARSRVLALPGVERADITREWPNRVAITVKERAPFALVNAGRLYWVDAEGAVLGPLVKAAVPPGPVLSGVEAGEMVSGAKLPSDRLAQGLSFLRELHRAHAPLAEVLSEVDLTRPIGLVLYTLDGIEVRMGSGAWKERLVRLEALLENLKDQGEPVGSIDLRFRDLVVLKPKKERSAGRP